MKKRRWLIGLMFGVIAILGLSTTPAHADQSSGAGFTMQIEKPANTIDETQSYFNLKVRPNQKQTLAIKVINLQDRQRTVRVTPVSAYTNDNVQVAYRPHVAAGQTLANYQFSDLVSGAQTVTVAPKATKVVKFQLRVPTHTFRGLIDGGFKAEGTDQKPAKAEKGFSINNRYALLMGATLQEDTKRVSPTLKLTAVTPKIVNQTTTLVANLNNAKPVLFGQMTIKSQVTKVGSDKVLHSQTKRNLTVAPSTAFGYRMDWNREPFKPGKYNLHLVATSGTKEWIFDQRFTISRQEAAELNQRGHNLKKSYLWLWILFGILLLILLLIAVYYYGRHQAKKSAE
ncbi:DUF916 and DUF3324 domain-containing protein [Levilactobacillus bambusae]|uniref:Uncharacterized protein n=1 Tax=Levilactobacillus bambusae TaxID=2024736 RepID=A0A2V1MZY3_9LACO|nr:DUF916 and DUF3324 domain-containing protein [Levilactobacillus bambusae]PWF99685.1 hypothetical protein DCM90_07670 [Levilactobacillus bambusae]